MVSLQRSGFGIEDVGGLTRRDLPLTEAVLDDLVDVVL
jgi:hypothetical protein